MRTKLTLAAFAVCMFAGAASAAPSFSHGGLNLVPDTDLQSEFVTTVNQSTPSTLPGSTPPNGRPADRDPVVPQVNMNDVQPPDFQVRPTSPPDRRALLDLLVRPDREGNFRELIGATHLQQKGGACYGMITCCNTYHVNGCNPEYFEDVCTIYEGVVVVNTFSDGSLNYECHYTD